VRLISNFSGAPSVLVSEDLKDADTMHPVQRHYDTQSASGTFTTQELQRLAVYRAAVVAGFYNDDWDGARAPTARDLPVETDGPRTGQPNSDATAEQLAR